MLCHHTTQSKTALFHVRDDPHKAPSVTPELLYSLVASLD